VYLAILVGLVVALSPLLRGAWDLWALTGISLAVLAGSSIWLAFQITAGNMPLPHPNRALAWILFMAVLVTASLAFSPVRGLIEREWWTWIVGFWILLAVPLIPEERRGAIEAGILASAWILAAFAWYQRIFQHEWSPESTLVNPNVFAGYLVMVLPLALSRGQRALSFVLVLALVWTRSLGAWLAVSVLLLALSYRRGGPMFGLSLIIGSISLVSLHDKLATASASERLAWWRAAWEMALRRPVIGFGPGAFAHVLPAFRTPGGGLGSLYAHQYFLEVAAGCGFVFIAAWLVWVFRRMAQSRGWPAWSLAGVLLHSLVDFPLSFPSNFWLFCYLLVVSQPERQVWFDVRSRLKIPLLIGLTGVSVWAGHRAVAGWRAERRLALASSVSTPPADSERLIAEAAALAPDDPAPLDAIAARRLLAFFKDGGRGRLLEATGLKERSVELDPYRLGAWHELVRLYRLDGRPDLADDARSRAERFFFRRDPRTLGWQDGS
jgi:O-antigen ligase